MSTKSMIWQSFFSVSGESLIPRPIYERGQSEPTGKQEGEHEERTIWAMTFRDRVGRATIMQSMFGMSAPSVKIAEPFKDIKFAPVMGGKNNEPQFTRTGYFPVLKPSTSNLRSVAGVLECTYLASIPASRNVWVSSLTWERLTQNTKVDLRLSAPRK